MSRTLHLSTFYSHSFLPLSFFSPFSFHNQTNTYTSSLENDDLAAPNKTLVSCRCHLVFEKHTSLFSSSFFSSQYAPFFFALILLSLKLSQERFQFLTPLYSGNLSFPSFSFHSSIVYLFSNYGFLCLFSFDWINFHPFDWIFHFVLEVYMLLFILWIGACLISCRNHGGPWWFCKNVFDCAVTKIDFAELILLNWV